MFPGGEYRATVYQPPLPSLTVAMPILTLFFHTHWAGGGVSGWDSSRGCGWKLTVVAVLGKLALGNNLVLVVLYLSEPTHTLSVILYESKRFTYQP